MAKYDNSFSLPSHYLDTNKKYLGTFESKTIALSILKI